MGRDKRMYRFVQDTAYGRIVLAESHEAAKIADAVTSYVARRLVERERALSLPPVQAAPPLPVPPRRNGLWTFVLGFIAGALALFALALFAALRIS